MPRPSQSRSGFSLIEIVIAIGITAFTLATIAGIFGVTSQSAQDSSRDTLMTSMIGQVMSDLRPLPFDTLWQTDPRGDTQTYLGSLTPNADSPPQPASTTPATSYYYFTSEGVLIEPTGTASPSATGYASAPSTTVYRCKVLKTVDTTTQSFVTTAGTNPGFNRLQLTLSFDWPVAPGAANTSNNAPNVKLVYESIARYF